MDHEFEASLGYKAISKTGKNGPISKTNKQTKKRTKKLIIKHYKNLLWALFMNNLI
jgi:hypothetical protein